MKAPNQHMLPGPMTSGPSSGAFSVIGSGAEPEDGARDDFAADVRHGLTAAPKRLPCRWLYDEVGSRLFEQICAVPEYYVPRAERSILEAHAGDIAAALPPGATLVELGSGNAAKTRLLIEAFLARAPGRVRYIPIDISPSMLVASSRDLLADYPRLDITGIAGTYEEGLVHLSSLHEKLGDVPRLILWLGSNVGNFGRAEAAAFMREIRRDMRPDDRFLLGVDLRKDPAILALAYDDPAGVTARFSLNFLARINRELEGEFDLADFRHRAVYDAADGRVGIYLVARRAHRVAIGALDITVSFAAGEAIHTEDSYKYDDGEIAALAGASGFDVVERWTDPEVRFASVLLGPR
jgi:L-histidine N-alpha-methyltransferase